MFNEPYHHHHIIWQNVIWYCDKQNLQKILINLKQSQKLNQVLPTNIHSHQLVNKTVKIQEKTHPYFDSEMYWNIHFWSEWMERGIEWKHCMYMNWTYCHTHGTQNEKLQRKKNIVFDCDLYWNIDFWSKISISNKMNEKDANMSNLLMLLSNTYLLCTFDEQSITNPFLLIYTTGIMVTGPSLFMWPTSHGLQNNNNNKKKKKKKQ